MVTSVSCTNMIQHVPTVWHGMTSWHGISSLQSELLKPDLHSILSAANDGMFGVGHGVTAVMPTSDFDFAGQHIM